MGKIYSSYPYRAKDTAKTLKHLFLRIPVHINQKNLNSIQGLRLQKHVILRSDFSSQLFSLQYPFLQIIPQYSRAIIHSWDRLTCSLVSLWNLIGRGHKSLRFPFRYTDKDKILLHKNVYSFHMATQLQKVPTSFKTRTKTNRFLVTGRGGVKSHGRLCIFRVLTFHKILGK